jgi:serine/threonine protein kinase
MLSRSRLSFLMLRTQVRVFRGEFVGQIGGSLSSKGLDRRVLVKEFTGEMALQLARYELLSIGKLQSDLLADNAEAKNGDWLRAASLRSSTNREDNDNLGVLARRLSKAPFLGIFGEVNLAELDGDMDPNDFYRALGVPPPKPEAVWVVYEYAGLNTISSYSIPAKIRWSRIPPKKGFFGSIVEPPPIPDFRDRSNYVVKGIMKDAVEALANLHDSGIAHRSIGSSSFILTSLTQDKREAVDLYFTRASGLVVKLADFGFSGKLEESTFDDYFLTRARSFGFSFRKGDQSLNASNFAMAEDLHALGFVFLGLLLSSLAELPRADFPMPATDEDTLQRLLGEIFGKDVNQFREYVEAEEVWSSLVDLLDENNGAGWSVLETLFLAREKAAENKNSLKVITARGLLSNPFFAS